MSTEVKLWICCWVFAQVAMIGGISTSIENKVALGTYECKAAYASPVSGAIAAVMIPLALFVPDDRHVIAYCDGKGGK